MKYAHLFVFIIAVTPFYALSNKDAAQSYVIAQSMYNNHFKKTILGSALIIGGFMKESTTEKDSRLKFSEQHEGLGTMIIGLAILAYTIYQCWNTERTIKQLPQQPITIADFFDKKDQYKVLTLN